jgi:hypothetical protein
MITLGARCVPTMQDAKCPPSLLTAKVDFDASLLVTRTA